jgi:hypothetical protein
MATNQVLLLQTGATARGLCGQTLCLFDNFLQ